MVGGLLLAIGASVITASAASLSVSPPATVSISGPVTADDLKPAQCVGITLTAVVVGSGTFSGAVGDVNELILGSSLADTINGDGGDDCILGGGNDDTLDGEAGDDSLIGGPGTDTCTGGGQAGDIFDGCETTNP